MGNQFFRNQHNFLRRSVMTIFFIHLHTELNYLSNDIILCGFVLWFTRYIGGRPKFDFQTMPNSE